MPSYFAPFPCARRRALLGRQPHLGGAWCHRAVSHHRQRPVLHPGQREIVVWDFFDCQLWVATALFACIWAVSACCVVFRLKLCCASPPTAISAAGGAAAGAVPQRGRGPLPDHPHHGLHRAVPQVAPPGVPPGAPPGLLRRNRNRNRAPLQLRLQPLWRIVPFLAYPGSCLRELAWAVGCAGWGGRRLPIAPAPCAVPFLLLPYSVATRASRPPSLLHPSCPASRKSAPNFHCHCILPAYLAKTRPVYPGTPASWSGRNCWRVRLAHLVSHATFNCSPCRSACSTTSPAWFS